MSLEDARLTLLQTELNSIQSAIGGLDTMNFQIKGWCVTTILVIGGFAAINNHRDLLFDGLGASLGFCLVDCQFRIFFRYYADRNKAIDAEIKEVGIEAFLAGASSMVIIGTAAPSIPIPGRRHRHRYLGYAKAFWSEAIKPHMLGFYLFIWPVLASKLD